MTAPIDIETAMDERERLAIITESRDVHPARAASIARCEATWRRGGQCVCMAHEPHQVREPYRVGGYGR